MRVVHLDFQDIRELLSHYQSMIRSGGFFWPTRQELMDNEDVLVEVTVADLEQAFAIECVVLGSLRDRGFEVESGYLLAFKPDQESKARQLMEVVGYQLIDSNRRMHPRFSKALAVAWRHGETEDLQVGHTENVGLGGLFIRSEILAPQDTVLTVHLRVGERFSTLTVNGRVAWTRTDDEELGMGVQFLNLQPSEGVRLHKLLTTEE